MELGPETRVLVTGASRGIGEAIAWAFAARRCTVGLVARSTDQLERLAAALPGEGHVAIAADVADAGSIARAIERFGDVDVLVANAGITQGVNWLGTLHTVPIQWTPSAPVPSQLTPCESAAPRRD